MMWTRRRGAVSRLVATGAATLVLAVGAPAGGTGVAAAADHPFQRGPAPTEAGFSTPTGPFAVAASGVPGGNGFGGGTVWYPHDTTQDTFGAVVIAPGFIGAASQQAWFGPRLSSQGFVVLLMDTNGLLDQPDSRAGQILAALRWMTTSSPLRTLIDPERLAVMGHSMGGGGALEASLAFPGLRAAIPMEPYAWRKDYSADRVPTLVIAAQFDTDAPTFLHAKPIYASLPATPGKAYLEIAGGNHGATSWPSDLVAKFTITWLKRFVDDDTRYDRFLCPVPAPGNGISAYQGTCPPG